MSLSSILSKLDAQAESDNVKVAAESISNEVEKEYCMWVNPTSDGWKALADAKGKTVIDILYQIPNGKRRIRIECDDDVKSELTLKVFLDNGDKLEENSDIGNIAALSFLLEQSLNVHIFKRISLAPSDELKEKGAKHWDIDVFYKLPTRPLFRNVDELKEFHANNSSNSNYLDLVKIELEVEKFFTNTIVDILPITVENAYSSKPKDEKIKDMISNFWDVESVI